MSFVSKSTLVCPPGVLPPHSREMEELVLGLSINRANCLHFSASVLRPEDFYFSEHRIIFEILLAAYCQDKPVDTALAIEELRRRDLLDAVGGESYLLALAQCAGTSAYIEEYAEKVHEKAILRALMEAAQEIERKALNEPENVGALLDDAQGRLFAIGQRRNARGSILVRDFFNGTQSVSQAPFLKLLEQRQEAFLASGGEGCTGVPTRFEEFDKLTGGLCASNLIILAARPAMGKTALALNIAERVALKGSPVGIFSLEMTAEQIVLRMVCSQSRVESEKLQTGSLNGTEYQRVVQAVNALGAPDVVIVVDDQPGLRINELRARARRMKDRYQIKLLIVDYLQLITSDYSKGAESRQLQIADISRWMKTLARELDIPVLCLSQLSRKVEDRPGHKPLLSDLRESGSIEQDADQVVLMFRPDCYDVCDKPGIAIVNLAKNRHGPVGEFWLSYQKEFAQFDNLAVD